MYKNLNYAPIAHESTVQAWWTFSVVLDVYIYINIFVFVFMKDGSFHTQDYYYTMVIKFYGVLWYTVTMKTIAIIVHSTFTMLNFYNNNLAAAELSVSYFDTN